MAASESTISGVQPLRAGEGNSFLWRRLHSLSGIIPIGAFLLEHFLSNAAAIQGPAAYAEQVRFLNSLPLVPVLEFFGIYLPITYHGLYGIYIWLRGKNNVAEYPWTGNWLYTSQRWTGIVAFLYMGYHVYTQRFSGIHLGTHPEAAFGKVQAELLNPWILAFYVAGIVAASWHFAYGVWLFCAKWGITTGQRAQKWLGYICLLLAIALIGGGLATLAAFRSAPVQSPGSQVETQLR